MSVIVNVVVVVAAAAEIAVVV